MSNKPNILFICSDQHRYDCIGNSNEYPVKTPNIDRLASEGVWFKNAFTPIPLCCPARQSLLNGRRPEKFSAFWNYDQSLKTQALEPEDYSWPRQLKKAGYSTSYVGKWHVNPTYNPTYYGFDNYIGLEDYEEFINKKYEKREFKNGFFGEIDPVPIEDTRTHWQADRVIEYIEDYTEKNEPWHIRLDFVEPHLPCCPVKEFADLYSKEDVVKWESFDDTFENKPYIQKQQLVNWEIEDMNWDDWSEVVARYYAIITQMDDAIGKVLDYIDELGIAKDTIVIYTADHGDMCGGHRMMDKHYILYDDVVHVPLIIRWPGVYESFECKELVYNCLDLPPTILSILGLEQQEFFVGRTMEPLLRQEKVLDWRKEVVSTYNGQQFGLYTQRMIRNDKFKYIWNLTDVDELYDMENDIGELNNLIYHHEYKLIIADLRKKLYEILLEEGDGLVQNNWLKSSLLKSRKI